MVGKRVFISVVMLLMVAPVLMAQTPTPLPGTPMALTCVDFIASPGLSGVENIASWGYLDRTFILLENGPDGAIEISQCQGYFTQTYNPIEVHIRIWEVRQEALLPDVLAAASQVSVTYAFSFDPIPGAPQVALMTFDLEGYEGGSVPMPVINPGRKFIVEFMNLMDQQGSGVPGMRITAEIELQCPPAYWQDGTNIFFNYDEDTPANSTWNFKEDIGLDTNFYMGITYYDNATPRAPAMGTWGLIGLLLCVSMGIMKRRVR
ncbi:hypothetical protein JXA80_01570 [bacterium]|nr:hypothetical protein [candidate division CSSED10-310 bacterium]